MKRVGDSRYRKQLPVAISNGLNHKPQDHKSKFDFVITNSCRQRAACLACEPRLVLTVTLLVHCLKSGHAHRPAVSRPATHGTQLRCVVHAGSADTWFSFCISSDIRPLRVSHPLAPSMTCKPHVMSARNIQHSRVNQQRVTFTSVTNPWPIA